MMLPMIIMVLTICIIDCEFVMSEESTKPPTFQFQHAKDVDSSNLQTLKSAKTLSLLYYYFPTAAPPPKSFALALDNSAKHLESYHITLAWMDCESGSEVVRECKHTNAGKHVFIYQNGMELISLEMEVMFDVNSIMANCLQLLLLREVPLLETMKERQELEALAAGNKDVLIYYTPAIGTMEHRIFMEIAYFYHDKYRFALMTDLSVSKSLKDGDALDVDIKSALWTLFCSETSADTKPISCRSILSKGGFSLSSLAKYVKHLPDPNLTLEPEICQPTVFDGIEGEIPTVFILINKELLQHSPDAILSLSYDFRGFAYLKIINIENENCNQLFTKRGFDGHAPGIGAIIPTHEPTLITFMAQTDSLNSTEIREFIDSVNLSKTYKEELSGLEVEIQDDEVAEDMFKSLVDEDELPLLPSVLKATFQDIVLNAKLKVVLYYLPFDTVSLAFLQDFDAAAKMLSSAEATSNLVARVNCFDATDLCAKENVTRYPVVHIHKTGQPYQVYEGALDTKSVVKAIQLLSLDFPVTVNNKKELSRFLKGDYPAGLGHLSPSSVLFLASQEDKESLAVFQSASQRLASLVAMAQVDGSLHDALASEYGSTVPGVVSIHHTDPIDPVRLLASVDDVDQVVQFVHKSTIPAMTELTADNFPVLRTKDLPFIILFVNQEKNDLKSTLRSTALMPQFVNKYIFCWMDVQTNSTGEFLLGEYLPDKPVPAIAVVDHKQGKIFAGDANEMTSSLMTEWLEHILEGKLQPTGMLSDQKWSPPGPYYDFLTKIDNDVDEEDVFKDFPVTVNRADELEDVVRQQLIEEFHDKNKSDKMETNLPLTDDTDNKGDNLQTTDNLQTVNTLKPHNEL